MTAYKTTGGGLPKARMALLALATAALQPAFAQAPPEDGYPEDEPRMVAFLFNRASQSGAHCPKGWSELEEARGRLVLAMTDPSRLPRANAKQGLPIRGRTLHGEHAHRLKLKTSAEMQVLDLYLDGANPHLTRAGRITIGGHVLDYRQTDPNAPVGGSVQARTLEDGAMVGTEPGHWSFPYMPLLVCQQDRPTKLTRALPLNSVMFFIGRRCPTGERGNDVWQVYEEAAGRFIVTTMGRTEASAAEPLTGTTSGTAATRGFTGAHRHPDASYRFALETGGIADWDRVQLTPPWPGLPSHLWYLGSWIDFSYTQPSSEADPPAHIELLPCIKSSGYADRHARALVPPMLSIFSADQHCDGSGAGQLRWITAPNGGFLLVGLEPGQDPITPVGEALTAGQPLTHRHRLSAALAPEQSHTRQLRGQGYQELAVPKAQQTSWDTGDSQQVLPTILLRHCTLAPETRQSLSTGKASP